MDYNQLFEGQEIEMFHHFNTVNYFWQKGIVSIMSDGKYFLPRGMITKIRIVPHRLDEIRSLAL